jgi:hypothetical protein
MLAGRAGLHLARDRAGDAATGGAQRVLPGELSRRKRGFNKEVRQWRGQGPFRRQQTCLGVLVLEDRTGLYGGAALKGGAVAPDDEANRVYYGERLRVWGAASRAEGGAARLLERSPVAQGRRLEAA